MCAPPASASTSSGCAAAGLLVTCEIVPLAREVPRHRQPM
jgi:hypothetical protein